MEKENHHRYNRKTLEQKAKAAPSAGGCLGDEVLATDRLFQAGTKEEERKRKERKTMRTFAAGTVDLARRRSNLDSPFIV